MSRKMKQMRSFLAMALALTALAGCNKENEVPDMNPGVEGVKTYAAFSVSVKAAESTRAVTGQDDNADAVEQTISTLNLFIFNGGVLETTGTITLGANNVGTTTLVTTTGAKEIYAVANAKSDMTLAIGKTLADFKALAVNAGTTDGATADNNIAATGAFVMIGKTEVTLAVQNEEYAISNPIAITVARGAAKVQMQYNTATVTINANLKGTFSEPKYLVAQMNTKMFLPRQDYELTPVGATADQADTTPDGTYDHLTTVPADMTNAKDAAAAWNYQFTHSFYTAENVNEAPVTGNTTFALVQLKYVPNKSEIQGSNKDLAPDGTFYLLWNKTAKTGTIYADQSEANTAQAQESSNLEVKTYTGGRCYYRVNLRDIAKTALQQKYCVLRNHFYKINITQINSLGGSSTTDPDVVVPTEPTTPLEESTYISADITIEAWNAILMNEPLG